MEFIALQGMDVFKPLVQVESGVNSGYAIFLTLFVFLLLLQFGITLLSIYTSQKVHIWKQGHVNHGVLYTLAQLFVTLSVIIIAFTSNGFLEYDFFENIIFFLLFTCFGVCSLSLLSKDIKNELSAVAGSGILIGTLGFIADDYQVYLTSIALSAIILMHLFFSIKVKRHDFHFLRYFYIFISFLSVGAIVLPLFFPVLKNLFLICSVLFLLGLCQWCKSVAVLWRHFNLAIDSREKEKQLTAEEEKQKLETVFKNLHDEITGCPNDGYLIHYLNNNVKEGLLPQFALFCIRVRGLRNVQNALGVDTSNGLLLACAQRLAVIGHAIDDFLFISNHENSLGTVVRSEGQEFFMVSKTTDMQSLQRFCAKLNETFTVPFEYGGLCLDLQSNVGVSLFPLHGSTPQQIMQNANIAVDIAKRGYYDRVFFDPMLDPSVQRRLILLGDLRGALNRGDIFMMYQPQVCVSTNQVLGVEALIRWQHPLLGEIAPDEFIPLAEQTGMIRHISPWVCDQAAMDFVRLALEGFNLKMSINISPHNLLEDNFSSVILAILEEYEVPTHSFCVELTETAVMLDSERVLSSIEYLTQQGILFSIDDFGTGFSSLANLKRLKVKQLKIDKDFVCNLEYNTDDEAIVRATIEMAHCLGVQTVAEGVESLAVIEKLKILGCNVVQGFHIAKPMPVGELIEWLASRPHQTKKIQHLA